MKKGSDLLVEALENEGVDRVFGVPGEENLDVVESLRKSKIELVLTRHEQAAAFMAATHGRLTGRPGVGDVGGKAGVVVVGRFDGHTFADHRMRPTAACTSRCRASSSCSNL